MGTPTVQHHFANPIRWSRYRYNWSGLSKWIKHNNDHNVDICDYEFYNDNSVSIILNPLDVITIRLLSENNDMPIEFHDKNLDSSFSLEIFHV